MNKTELISYINDFLQITNFEDGCVNWLQIDSNKQEVKKIWYAVDFSTYLAKKAVSEKVDLMLVHHGIFGSFNTITSDLFHRAKELLQNDICLCGYHLPLDANLQLGNSAIIKNKFVEYFKIKNFHTEQILKYNWIDIWVWIKDFSPIPVSELSNFCKSIWIQNDFFNNWKLENITSLAILTWWGWSAVSETKELGYDLLLTWEAKHGYLVLAKEIWQSILLWWHYETETFWVEYLSKHLQDKFWLEIIFLDEKY